MRIIVYPHAMEIGGSQLNAIEIGAAVRDLGHDVLVVSEPGPLVDTVRSLGLEHVEVPADRRRPSAAVARLLVRLARERGTDVVHGYEWPPGIEAFFGPRLRLGVPAVCTVMSAAVAPFLPRSMPLIVGTEELRGRAARDGHAHVTLLEPPVNVHANSPDFDPGSFRADFGLDEDVPLVVVVCRLARELKLEGLLAACDTVGALVRDGVAVRLAIVGDGPVRDLVAERAAKANADAGQEAVVLTGELADPRPAYAAADIMLGMGGSALRGMAFGKPLIVQGERGFWRTCTPETVAEFLHGGWYGLADGRDGAPRLRAELAPLLAQPARRAELGAFARRLVVERFSLEQAAKLQLSVYEDAVGAGRTAVGREALRSGAGVTAYKVRRKLAQLRGSVPTDDFNALRTAPQPADPATG